MIDNQKGFSGLGKQTSNIDDLINSVSNEKAEDQTISENISQNLQSQSESPNSDPRDNVKVDRDRKIPWAWGIGAIIIGFVIYVNATDSNKSKSTSTSISNTSSSPGQVIEQIPPIGTDLVLNEAQITYCLSQEIRINGAESATDNTNQFKIKKFNTLVDDYNSRCSKFRYKTSDMQRAKSHVETKRQNLYLEGIVQMR